MRKPTEFDEFPIPFGEGTYRAICKHIVDGDTYDFLVDLGLNNYAYITVRLKDYNTPEIFRPRNEEEKERGQRAKTVMTWLMLGMPCLLYTYKDKESFGRYIAEVIILYPGGKSQHVGEYLKKNDLLKREEPDTE